MDLHTCGREHDPDDACCQCGSVHTDLWGTGEACAWDPEREPSRLVEIRYVPGYLIDQYRLVGPYSGEAFVCTALLEESCANRMRTALGVIEVDGDDTSDLDDGEDTSDLDG